MRKKRLPVIYHPSFLKHKEETSFDCPTCGHQVLSIIENGEIGLKTNSRATLDFECADCGRRTIIKLQKQKLWVYYEEKVEE